MTHKYWPHNRCYNDCDIIDSYVWSLRPEEFESFQSDLTTYKLHENRNLFVGIGYFSFTIYRQ